MEFTLPGFNMKIIKRIDIQLPKKAIDGLIYIADYLWHVDITEEKDDFDSWFKIKGDTMTIYNADSFIYGEVVSLLIDNNIFEYFIIKKISIPKPKENKNGKFRNKKL